MASRFLRESYGALRWRGDSIVGAMETERIAYATQTASPWFQGSLDQATPPGKPLKEGVVIQPRRSTVKLHRSATLLALC